MQGRERSSARQIAEFSGVLISPVFILSIHDYLIKMVRPSGDTSFVEGPWYHIRGLGLALSREYLVTSVILFVVC
jgi:hypothetical protein